MKKIKLMLSLIVMMMGGVLSANATRKIVDLSTIQSNGTTSVWDNATKTLTWNTTGGGATVQIPGFSGDLSEWETLILETEENTSVYRCVIKVNRSDGQKDYTWNMYSAGTKNLVLTGENTGFECDGQKLTKELLKSVVNVQIGGTWASSGSLKINSITLVKPFKLAFGDDGKAHISVSDLDVTGNVTIDAQTGVATSTGTGTISVSLPNADFSAVTRVDVTRSGDDICNAMEIFDAVNGKLETWNDSKYGCDFTSYQNMAGQVNKITWNVNAAGTMTISDIVITSAVITGAVSYQVPDGCTDAISFNTKIKSWYGTEVSYPKTFRVQQDGWGSGSPSTTNVINDSPADFISFVVTEGSPQGLGLRVWVTDGTTTKTLYAYPIAQAASVESWETSYKIQTPGVYVTKITGYKISGIKAANDYGANPIVVALAYTSTGNTPTNCDMNSPILTLSGKGIVVNTAKEILNNENATLIDATGVTGSNVSLVSANPNCIFLANAGVLANTQNVCVGSTIANLVITDGYPFAAPAGASATAASYERGVSGNWGTVCLPYAISGDEKVQLYEVSSVESNVVNLTPIDNADAGQPVIFKRLNSSANIEFASSGSLANASTTAELKGTFTKQVFTSGDLTNKYYISGDEFRQATNSLTVNPFRAYLETVAAESNLRIIANDFESDETTGVQEEFMSDGTVKVIEGYYSIGGAPVTADYPGITVVKYTDGTTQTIKK